MHRPILSALAALAFVPPPAPPDAPPVVASVVTTMTTSGSQVRQLAFDGDPASFFATKQAGPTDHFTLVLDAPVSLKSVGATTGQPDGRDALDAGTLEVSADGKDFQKLAEFAQGTAKADAGGRTVLALRIRPAGEPGRRPLAIREVTIESDPPVATFRHPVEVVVVADDAPDLKDWAEKAARECERWYPRIVEELRTEGDRPPRRITLELKSDYDGVAEAGGRRITGSARYFRDHPDDVGAMIHETTHLVQRYHSQDNPGWLVEGVADYIRFFRYEPGKIGPIDSQTARYDASYRTSAAFLAYLADTYDPLIVRKLNKVMREGTYKEDIFRELTGKPVQELGEEWKKTLK